VRAAAIIVNWNSWGELTGCLEALMAQSEPFDRILVIDNDSRDPAPAAVSDWQDAGLIELYSLAANEGFAKANNIAIAKVVDCDWIALVNPDAFLDPAWHEQMRRAAAMHPRVASFSSAMLMANDRSRWDGLGDVYHISGLVWRRAHGRREADVMAEAGPVFSPCAAAAFYRRESVIEAGGFDEDYFCYLEDVDLGFRLRLLGYDARLNPGAVCYHVGSATTGSQHSDFAVYHGHRNLVWTFLKDMPGVLLWSLLPLHLVLNLITVLRFAVHGQGRVILRSKWDAIKGIPAVWRKRRALQAGRQCSTRELWRMLDKSLFTRN